MDDKPLLASGRKKDSSMMRAVELRQERRGRRSGKLCNTGSLVAAIDSQLRMLEGMDRAALRQSFRGPADTSFSWMRAPTRTHAPNTLSTCHHRLALCAHRAGVLGAASRIADHRDRGGQGKRVDYRDARGCSNGIGFARELRRACRGFQLFSDHVDVVVCDGFGAISASKAGVPCEVLHRRTARPSAGESCRAMGPCSHEAPFRRCGAV